MTALQQIAIVKLKSNCVPPRSRQNNKINKHKTHTYKISRSTLVGVLIAEVLWHSQAGPDDSKIINMPTLPQGAFAACKVREQFQERDYILSRMKTAGTDKNDLKNSADNQPQREYTPAKYNEKLMNSIWGLYNRYSPHNVKMNEYVPKKY